MKYLVVQAFRSFDEKTEDFIYRIKNPGNNLQTHPLFNVTNIHVFHPLFSQLALSADALILHELPNEEIYRVIYNRRKMGKPTIFEIAADITRPAPNLPASHVTQYIENRQNMMYFASLCDGLQVSTPELGKMFSFLNNNTVVFESHCNDFPQKNEPKHPFVLGYGGPDAREEDLAQIAPAIVAFCLAHREARFHFMGYPPLFHRYFGKLPENQKLCVDPHAQSSLTAFLQNIHIGLSPMADTLANNCRSDMKFIEYASHGVLPVVADAVPHKAHGVHGENCLMYKDPEDLRNCLENLYQDRQIVASLAEKAQKYARVKRKLSNYLGRQVVFLEKLLKHEPFLQKMPPLPDCSGLMTYMHRASLEMNHKNYQEASDILDKVLQLHPGYQLAHMTKAKAMIALDKNQEVLQAYADFKIDPVFLDMLLNSLTRAAQRLHNPLWREFHKLIVEPSLKALLDADASTNREVRLRTILSHHPYHYQSLLFLGQMLIKQKDPDAVPLLERALFLSPEANEARLLHEQAVALVS